jgi:hypothetical protein
VGALGAGREGEETTHSKGGGKEGRSAPGEEKQEDAQKEGRLEAPDSNGGWLLVRALEPRAPPGGGAIARRSRAREWGGRDPLRLKPVAVLYAPLSLRSLVFVSLSILGGGFKQ